MCVYGHTCEQIFKFNTCFDLYIKPVSCVTIWQNSKSRALAVSVWVYKLFSSPLTLIVFSSIVFLVWFKYTLNTTNFSTMAIERHDSCSQYTFPCRFHSPPLIIMLHTISSLFHAYFNACVFCELLFTLKGEPHHAFAAQVRLFHKHTHTHTHSSPAKKSNSWN